MQGVGEPLDNTDIHPELYSAARLLAKRLCLDLSDLGSPEFSRMASGCGLSAEGVARELGVEASQAELILSCFRRRRGADVRLELTEAVYKSGVRGEARLGEVLLGRVTNVTHFGAFVDVGLDSEALLHVSSLGASSLRLGHRVEVRVESVLGSKVSLQLIRIIQPKAL